MSSRKATPRTTHDNENENGRRWNYDGSAYEDVAAYARAVRHGNYIAVSGTVDMAEDGTAAHPGDVYRQTLRSFQKSIAAIEKLGGTGHDIIRTRIFLGHGEDWTGAVRAHKELFEGIDPANTSLFVAGFFVPGVLVEVEVDAIVNAGDTAVSPANPTRTELERA
jgi:enamine deaminase RidA (YjgF/YER057c/UK114 family)